MAHSTAVTWEWPAIHAFAPMYSQQINADTEAIRMDSWCGLIVAYFKHHKLYKLDVDAWLAYALFDNKTISRSLTRQGLLDIIDSMVQRGNAEWETPDKAACTIMFRTVREWAGLIYAWAKDTIQGVTEICTLYELQHGDDVKGTLLEDIDVDVLRKALHLLEKDGKVQVFTASGSDEGVKFFF